MSFLRSILLLIITFYSFSAPSWAGPDDDIASKIRNWTPQESHAMAIVLGADWKKTLQRWYKEELHNRLDSNFGKINDTTRFEAREELVKRLGPEINYAYIHETRHGALTQAQMALLNEAKATLDAMIFQMNNTVFIPQNPVQPQPERKNPTQELRELIYSKIDLSFNDERYLGDAIIAKVTNGANNFIAFSPDLVKVEALAYVDLFHRYQADFKKMPNVSQDFATQMAFFGLTIAKSPRGQNVSAELIHKIFAFQLHTHPERYAVNGSPIDSDSALHKDCLKMMQIPDVNAFIGAYQLGRKPREEGGIGMGVRAAERYAFLAGNRNPNALAFAKNYIWVADQVKHQSTSDEIMLREGLKPQEYFQIYKEALEFSRAPLANGGLGENEVASIEFARECIEHDSIHWLRGYRNKWQEIVRANLNLARGTEAYANGRIQADDAARKAVVAGRSGSGALRCLEGIMSR